MNVTMHLSFRIFCQKKRNHFHKSGPGPGLPNCRGRHTHSSTFLIPSSYRSHSQLFCHTSKSCVMNFAFFAWNPFNLPRVVGWYHWNPQNRQKGSLFRGYKKSRKILFKSRKILNWLWRAHFWANRHLSHQFGNL